MKDTFVKLLPRSFLTNISLNVSSKGLSYQFSILFSDGISTYFADGHHSTYNNTVSEQQAKDKRESKSEYWLLTLFDCPHEGLQLR